MGKKLISNQTSLSREDSITLYEGEGFNGQQLDVIYIFDGDQPYLSKDNFGMSAIVTGCYGWTIYQ